MCACCTGTKNRIWHNAYRQWFDHNQAGHAFRATVWGWSADRLCVMFWKAA